MSHVASSMTDDVVDMVHSREVTPTSTATASSSYVNGESSGGTTRSGAFGGHGMMVGETSESSCGTSVGGMSSTLSTSQGEDMDKFKKRMELEQTMQTLQQRLKLASMKAENGWTDLSLNEIETKLPPPPTPPRRRGDKLTIHPPPDTITHALAPHTVPYEPPSPSRPWQLIDVLWQPLPPPRNGSPIPSSPRKRSRAETEDDEHDLHGSFSDHLRYPSSPGAYGSVPGPSQYRHSSPRSPRRPHHSHHARRASGSAHPYPPPSPLGPSTRFERRSQSTSQPIAPQSPVTYQDVNAAKALTSMFESGSPKPTPRQPSASSTGPNRTVGRHARHASLPNGSSLLPPIATDLSRPPSSSSKDTTTSPPRHSPLATSPSIIASSTNGVPAPPRKGSSDTVISETTRSVRNTTPPDAADKDAAELMMFLAHSPSPARTMRSPSRMTREGSGHNGAARVLFADMPGQEYKVERHSNLVSAPPITADSGI
ncbi:hypothetical protein BD324DRAFT_628170 [Kockovaella imperatae]|uniref:Uncharacterized protein n=1 Tax=Kockovaella imperatae TaxID=4999 RepID=A0A1Y1UFK4_9TREE|nr:hypothetical protein BD324DRAFT_628170 [Kockovaella imperatae]ORX36286.1 hypothetical protein BD324DRAFT_628170 [Kockovaella imperatae]